MEIIAVDVDDVLAVNDNTLIEKADFYLSVLSERFRLEVVTARNPRRVEETLGWLAINLPDVFSGVHFNRAFGGAEELTKGEVCQRIGASYLIDDLEEHCLTAAEVGVKAFLFGSYPQKEHESIHPVQGWADIIDYFS